MLATRGGYPRAGPSQPHPLLLLPQVPIYLVVLFTVLRPIVKLLELPGFGGLEGGGEGLSSLVGVMPWMSPTVRAQQGPGERSLPSTARCLGWCLLVPVPWARATRESPKHLPGVLTRARGGHRAGSALAGQKQQLGLLRHPGATT